MLYDNDLKQEMTSRYRESQVLFQQWWYQADLDLKMTVGQQDYWNQLLGTNYRNQRLLQFNKTLRVLNLISGYQRKNRHVSTVIPRENSDQETADQISGVLMWMMEQDDTYNKISDTFEGALITGLNLLHVWMDFNEDPENGDIKTTRCHHNQFIMDPYWRDPGLSDCQWVWKRSYLSNDQMKSILPDKYTKDISQMKRRNNTVDGKFLFMPENRQMYNMDLYAYDEYWKRTYKNVYKLFDTKTGEVVDIPKNMQGENLEVFLKMHPQITKIKVKKPSVKYHVIVNDNLVYEEDAPYGIDRFPFVPFLCYHFPEAQDYSFRYEGVVRNIRDSQIELNRRRNKMLDILDSQINSGFIVKEDALVDPESVFMTGQGRALFLKESAQITDVQQIPPAQIPPSMFEMQNLLDQEIMTIAGVNEELFGETDGKDTSGFMTQLRMGAGLVSLQNIFDRLRLSQKNLGELCVDLIQANFSPGKVRRILNEDPSEQFENKNFQKYDCIVEEGMLTSSQKQLHFMQLLHLREMGIPVPSDILLEASTLQNKNKLIESVQKAEQQQAQVQQQMQQLEMAKQALLTRSIEAKAQNDFASAQERQGRTISNIGLFTERESEQSKNMAQATLDYARALKELGSMDDTRMMDLARFIVEMQQAQQTLNTPLKDVNVADVVGKDIEEAKIRTNIVPKPQNPQQQVEEQQQVQQEIL